MRAHALLLERFEAAGDFDPLTMREYDALFVLAGAGGSMPMKDLVEGALVTQPSMSRLIDRLERKGYVVRTPSLEDGRALDVTLTGAGIEMQRRLGRRHVRTIAKELAPLSSQELEQLKDLCTRLLRNEE